MNPKENTVAAVIPTKNVQKIIRGALDSLRFCDEVIIVDMFSTDETKAICESYPNVRYFARNGYIYENFNFGMDQAKSNWIIRLDSDERLTIELQQEIQALLGGAPGHDVYTAPFVSYFLGEPIYHGTGESKGRRETLFRKGKLRYKARSEHEPLTPPDGVQVSTGELRGMYLHFSTPSIRKYLDKINYYTEKDFERAPMEILRVVPRWKLPLMAARKFFQSYIGLRGYKDGYHGFALACLDTIYFVVHYLKEWEKKTSQREHHDRVRETFDRSLGSGK
ncbi:MAG TPA: glycosyltransferase family 2 protein [Bdellovibrionales bacterium]|nr:glycosyltransferase family 2 protein [Bdellovibrionales bacterium]